MAYPSLLNGPEWTGMDGNGPNWTEMDRNEIEIEGNRRD